MYHRLVESMVKTRAGGWAFLHVFNPLDRRLLRWTNGAISTGLGTDFADNEVLLGCTGAKSGTPRDVPLLATPLNESWILIASAAGHAENPAWYYNLKAHPECSLLVRKRGESRFTARELDGEERARAWAAANAQYDGFTTYQGRTERRIPVMLLEPR